MQNVLEMGNEEKAELINELETVKAFLKRASDESFAVSLINQFHKKKKLSDKQWPWVQKLVMQAVAPPVPTTNDAIEVGNMTCLVDMFKLAKSKLKWPKITLQLEDGSPLQLSIAGPKSKFPGTINITDGGGFDSNRWYGRITVEGSWEPYKAMDEGKVPQITDLLTKLSKRPHATVTKYAVLTGRCAFCNKSLEHEKSTAVGMGLTCAKNWGFHTEWKSASKALA